MTQPQNAHTHSLSDGSSRALRSSATVIGGGLAGAEAAWQLAVRGVPVTLLEMRPGTTSPAHRTGALAELVCSNSLKGTDPATAAGLLKHELESMGSLVLAEARLTSVPAGTALAVDRARFSDMITDTLESQPPVNVVRTEATSIPPGPVIIATGPLTSPGLEPALASLVGSDRLAFYDAAAPIVEGESIDRRVLFEASRYDRGTGADYVNAPMTREEYEAFVGALVKASRTEAHDFERRDLFAACQPIEEIARTGVDALRFGPLKPVGLTDPRTGSRPWAVVQLRSENLARTAYNLVGFQTNLTFPEQKRVFRMIPGLAGAEFLRFGVMHRNTFIDAPRLLDNTLALRHDRRIRLAGQITGTEGYLEAAASGLLAALNTFADLQSLPPFRLPVDTALGSLIAYATNPDTTDYQPMHVNFGLLPALEQPERGKRARYVAFSARARCALAETLSARADLRFDTARRAAERLPAEAPEVAHE